MRRKLPPSPPPPPPDVTPESVPDEPALKLAPGDTTDETPRTTKEISKANLQKGHTKESKVKSRETRAVGHALRSMLEMTPLSFEQAMAQPKTKAEQIAGQIIVKASSGVQEAIKIVLDRTEGRVPQALEVNTNAHKEVHERVSDISSERANQAAIAAAGGALPEGAEVLDVPEDGPAGAQGDEREPGVEGTGT